MLPPTEKDLNLEKMILTTTGSIFKNLMESDEKSLTQSDLEKLQPVDQDFLESIREQTRKTKLMMKETLEEMSQ